MSKDYWSDNGITPIVFIVVGVGIIIMLRGASVVVVIVLGDDDRLILDVGTINF